MRNIFVYYTRFASVRHAVQMVTRSQPGRTMTRIVSKQHKLVLVYAPITSGGVMSYSSMVISPTSRSFTVARTLRVYRSGRVSLVCSSYRHVFSMQHV